MIAEVPFVCAKELETPQGCQLEVPTDAAEPTLQLLTLIIRCDRQNLALLLHAAPANMSGQRYQGREALSERASSTLLLSSRLY